MQYPEMKNQIKKMIIESSEIISQSSLHASEIAKTVDIISKCLKKGKKVVLFGNGGSAADAQHVAAEFVGRFKIERISYPALALNTDSSIITSIANDYSYNLIFSRQCESLVYKGDVVIGISTSGNSENVRIGLVAAKKKGAITIGLLGNNGGMIKDVVDISITVNSTSTPRIQEVHRVFFHIICDLVEQNLVKKN